MTSQRARLAAIPALLMTLCVSGVAPMPAAAQGVVPITPPQAGGTAPGCAARGDVRYVCGFANPEDLVRVGSTRWLVASGMAKGASLHAIDTQAHAAHVLPWSQATAGGTNPFAASCPGALDPGSAVIHGLAIRKGAQAGHYSLYGVNHGGRETIEAWDLDASGASPKLRWLGCVPMPTGLAANSVAAFDDGMLLATVLIMPGRTMGDSFAGRNTGEVLQWRPGAAGFSPMPGTELPANNGIEAAATGDEFYVVSSGLKRIYAFDRKDTRKPLRQVEFKEFTPDNVHASAEGPLFTAGMIEAEAACGGPPKADSQGRVDLVGCARGFVVASLDPATLKVQHTVRSAAFAPFMGASSAMPVGREVWVGGFHADRVAIHAWP